MNAYSLLTHMLQVSLFSYKKSCSISLLKQKMLQNLQALQNLKVGVKMMNENMQEKMTGKKFLNYVLNGAAIGIIVGILPNPILSAILGMMPQSHFVTVGTQVALTYQMATPIFIGALVGMQFKFSPLRVAVVAGASFLGSGVVRFNADLGAFVASGAGDILNTMLTAALACALLLFIGKKFGSTEIVFCSMTVGVGAGFIGTIALPYISQVTHVIGHGINTFTLLQPLLMSILLGMSSAFIILSPLSTVAIGLAIGLDGIAAGAFSMGVASVGLVLVVNSWKINKPGVTMACFLGAMKMFMPNLIKNPIILVPTFFTAAIAAIPVAMFSISGTPMSSGFGIIGMLGPLAAIESGLSLPLVAITWLVIPIVASLVGQVVFEKIFKLYDRVEVFGFTTEEPAEKLEFMVEKVPVRPLRKAKKALAS